MKRSILVVDDEPTARNMLRLILVRAGFEVMEAEDGYQALDQIERELPDLMVLDIMMPGIDGFEVCQRIRANKDTAELPVVMLSAKTDALSVKRGLEVGADKYLTKPVLPEELARQIRDVLSIDNEV